MSRNDIMKLYESYLTIKIILTQNVLYHVCDPQGLGGPRWQQLASRQFSVSAGLCGPDGPPTRADATFKVTMVPGDGVGPELMTAVKDVFKVFFFISFLSGMSQICIGRFFLSVIDSFYLDGGCIVDSWC